MNGNNAFSLLPSIPLSPTHEPIQKPPSWDEDITLIKKMRPSITMAISEEVGTIMDPELVGSKEQCTMCQKGALQDFLT